MNILYLVPSVGLVLVGGFGFALAIQYFSDQRPLSPAFGGLSLFLVGFYGGFLALILGEGEQPISDWLFFAYLAGFALIFALGVILQLATRDLLGFSGLKDSAPPLSSSDSDESCPNV